LQAGSNARRFRWKDNVMTTDDYMRDGLEAFLEGFRRQSAQMVCAICRTHDSDVTPVRDTEVGRRCWSCTPEDVKQREVTKAALI